MLWEFIQFHGSYEPVLTIGRGVCRVRLTRRLACAGAPRDYDRIPKEKPVMKYAPIGREGLYHFG